MQQRYALCFIRLWSRDNSYYTRICPCLNTVLPLRKHAIYNSKYS